MIASYFVESPLLQNILKGVVRVCGANKIDPTHGWQHALKIAVLTQQALAFEQLEEELKEDIMTAALLHEVDDKKYFPFSFKCENARAIMGQGSMRQERMTKVIEMIELVSFSKNGNSIKKELPVAYYLPRYVDRAEAIGVQGLYRSLEYNRHIAKTPPIYTQDTPRPLTRQELLNVSSGRQEQYMKRGGQSASVVDHIFDKLVHIELPGCITNHFLRELYQLKREEMIQFVLKHAKTDYRDYEADLMIQYQANANKWAGQKLA